MTPLTEYEAQQLHPGDKLVCISMEEDYTCKLEIGKVYTLTYIDLDTWVGVKEARGRYEFHCFALPDLQQQDAIIDMRNEVINLRYASEDLRRELGDFLIALGETLFNYDNLISKDYPRYLFRNCSWSGISDTNPTINILPFIEKYTHLISENVLQSTTEDPSVSIKPTTRVVVGESKEKFEKAVNELETEEYSTLPETFLINDKRYTILMQLNKPKEIPCLQL